MSNVLESDRADADTSTGPRKRQRVALACTLCRQRKTKCDGQRPCKNCAESRKPNHCHYEISALSKDREYIRNLEQRVRELSTTISGPPNNEPQLDSSIRNISRPLEGTSTHTFSASAPINVTEEVPNVFGIQGGDGHVHPKGIEVSLQSRLLSPQTHEDPESAFESNTHLLATLAPPSSSNDTADPRDSSARTFLHGVEAAAQMLPQRGPGKQSKVASPLRSTMSSPFMKNRRAEKIQRMWQMSQADLYTLPHRHLSDALVGVYQNLNYSSKYNRYKGVGGKTELPKVFRVLHWPTFLQQYEATFASGDRLDPIWLGILNQIYATACQIGGRDIIEGDETEAGLKFHQRALSLGYPVALSTDSLQVLQYLLLMGQYLMSTAQPSLCRNVVGHAVRSAKAQGLHLGRRRRTEDAFQEDLELRAWAGVVVLDATSSAALGMAPLLSCKESPRLIPSIADDEALSLLSNSSERSPLNYSIPSPSHPSSNFFMRENTRLLWVQIGVLETLYSSSSEDHINWPETSDILEKARELHAWQSTLPLILQTSTEGAIARVGSRVLELQAHVIHARYLNLKLLIHRPMLFYACTRIPSGDPFASAPSHLDADVARASIRHCCQAGLELVEHISSSWKPNERVTGAWWFNLYYFHSACLVIQAGLILELVPSSSAIFCLPDIPRALRAIKSAEIHLNPDPSETRSIVPRLPSGPAQNTARKCFDIISRITAHIISSAPDLLSMQFITDNDGLLNNTTHPQEINRSMETANLTGNGNGASTSLVEDNDGIVSVAADLHQTFLELFPDMPALPQVEDFENSNGPGLPFHFDTSMYEL